MTYPHVSSTHYLCECCGATMDLLIRISPPYCGYCQKLKREDPEAFLEKLSKCPCRWCQHRVQIKKEARSGGA